MENVTIIEKCKSVEANEAFKILRTNLQLCGEDKQVIAFTSCTPDEGKSTSTLELAIAFAEAGKKVLLIDADMRKSVLRRKVKKQGKTKGLSQYLTQNVPLTDVVYGTDYPGMCLIFSGPFPPNAAELLGGSKFKNMISVLRKVYDYILIDTPPLGSVIDCAVAAESCDGTVLVLEYGAVSYRMAQSVKEQLDKCDCPMLGVVYTKVRRDYSSSYGKYYKEYIYEE